MHPVRTPSRTKPETQPQREKKTNVLNGRGQGISRFPAMSEHADKSAKLAPRTRGEISAKLEGWLWNVDQSG
jgi:hypothetical protein